MRAFYACRRARRRGERLRTAYALIVLEKICFRRYQPQDLDQVRELHELALREAGAFATSGRWDDDLDDIAANYLAGNGNFLVGEGEGMLIAMGAWRRISGARAEIKRMRVHPNWQGLGLGRQMLEALEAEIIESDYAEIVLDTTIQQAPAQELYLSSGYRETRRMTEGYPLETIFYAKDLRAAASS